jgi:hypothetical protein
MSSVCLRHKFSPALAGGHNKSFQMNGLKSNLFSNPIHANPLPPFFLSAFAKFFN